MNLLASDVSQQLGYGALDLFSFTAIGVPVWLAGATYMLLAPRALLPDRRSPDDQLSTSQAMIGYFTEVTIPSTSTLVGQTLRHSRLQRRFDVDVLELQREENASFLLLRIAALRRRSPAAQGHPCRSAETAARAHRSACVRQPSSGVRPLHGRCGVVSLQCRRRGPEDG